MPWVTSIYDRTLEDVNEVKELLEKGDYKKFTLQEMRKWNSGMKGAFNQSDADRLANNANILIEKYSLKNNKILNTDFPNISFFNSILDVLKNIININQNDLIYPFDHLYPNDGLYPTTGITSGLEIPSLPSMPINDYIKLNKIEKIMEICYNG